LNNPESGRVTPEEDRQSPSASTQAQCMAWGPSTEGSKGNWEIALCIREKGHQGVHRTSAAYGNVEWMGR